MTVRNLALATCFVAASTAAALAPTPATAQAKEQFFPVLVYRTGAYAPNGVPFANGYVDYLKLVNARDGVVVLSENAGAHAELGEWALTVNPFDVEGQAQAIHEALSMDRSERKRRLDAIRTHVREHDVNEWLDIQFAALDRVATTARR